MLVRNLMTGETCRATLSTGGPAGAPEPAADAQPVDPLTWAVCRVLEATPDELAAFEKAGYRCHWLEGSEPDPLDVGAYVDAEMAKLWAQWRAEDPTLPELTDVEAALEAGADFTLPSPCERVTLRNTLHGTSVVVVCPQGLPHQLSRRQYRRVRDQLCGVDGCRCGGVTGPQEVAVEWIYPDRAEPTWVLG